MPQTSIRTYRPPEPPPVKGTVEQQLKDLQEWAKAMVKWAQDTQAAQQDFYTRAGL